MSPQTATDTLHQFQIQAAEISQGFFAGYLTNLGALKFWGLVTAIVIFAGAVYFVIETGWFTLRVDRFRHIVLQSDISRKHAQESWKKIREHFYRGSENDLKVAILEADKLLNDALRDAGVTGIQLGDRLKKATVQQIPNLNDLWSAHKLRNQIAHEPNFRLKRDLAERALGIYEEALRTLGIFNGK